MKETLDELSEKMSKEIDKERISKMIKYAQQTPEEIHENIKAFMFKKVYSKE